MSDLEHLDDIAREAFTGNYRRTGVLSTGELLYVALASGRMRELCPSDSIAYAVDRVGHEWMSHMLQVWRGNSQPTDGSLERFRKFLQFKLDSIEEHIPTLERQMTLLDSAAAARAKEALAQAPAEIKELRATLAYLRDFESQERESGLGSYT